MDTENIPLNNFSQHKTQHIEICMDPQAFLETSDSGFKHVRFCHQAMPETNFHKIDLSSSFLGKPIRLPLFISPMTGGSEHGGRLNKELALAAQKARVPMGTGSIRILYRRPELLADFQLKRFAPDVPIFSNIGAQQLVSEVENNFAELIEWNRRLEVDAVSVHLNPGQELFQDQGQRCFQGIKKALKRFIARSPHPVIVKETGFGISPREIHSLLSMGAAYVDIAGAGGTNWLAVEASREDRLTQEAAKPFEHWGWPTALLLAKQGRRSQKILASGGLRDGMDLAKALALGSQAGGFALPLLRAAYQGGHEEVLCLFTIWERTLRTVMALTGCQNLKSLRKTPLIFSDEFHQMIKNTRL